MFGKSIYKIPTNRTRGEIAKVLDNWAKVNDIDILRSKDHTMLFRYGNPCVSNPIKMSIIVLDGELVVKGWVQTLIPFFRWKLVDVADVSLLTKIDYRRKGGLFISNLKGLLS